MFSAFLRIEKTSLLAIKKKKKTVEDSIEFSLLEGMTVIKNPSKLLTKAKCFYLFSPGALHAYFCTTREAEPTNWWARNSLYRMCSSDYVGNSFLLKRIYSKSTVICLCMNGRCLCRPEQMNTCSDRCERILYAAHVRSVRLCFWWICSKT